MNIIDFIANEKPLLPNFPLKYYNAIVLSLTFVTTTLFIAKYSN